MLKNEILLNKNNDDSVIRLSLSKTDSFIGNQEGIDTFTKIRSSHLVNEIVDGDVTSFRFYNVNPYNTILGFYFNNNSSVFFPNFNHLFTSDEINAKSQVFENSFFIAEIYDSYDLMLQNRLAITYQSRLLNEEHNSRYDLSVKHTYEFSEIYIPNNYVDEWVDNFIDLYIKFSFYNAKTGKVILFFNKNSTNPISNTPSSERHLFFKMKLNVEDRTWVMDDSMSMTELITTNDLTNKINDTITSNRRERPIFPEGTFFNIDKLDYDTI